MTDADYSHFVFVADRSGSMGGIADPPHSKAKRTTEGIHAMVDDQRQLPGRVTFSLWDFDTVHEPVEAFGNGNLIKAWVCSPRGGTALLDAVGTAIARTGEVLATMPEDKRPGQVFVVVGTDGEENSSVEYTLAQVKDMVTRQHDEYGWQFVFIGADIDAFSEAGGMGMRASATLGTPAGAMNVAYLVTSDALVTSRSAGPGGQSVSYSTQQRQRVADAGK